MRGPRIAFRMVTRGYGDHMIPMLYRIIPMGITIVALSVTGSAVATAAPIYWTDWGGSNTDVVNGPFVATGTITTPTSTVDVTYSNPQGIGFYRATTGTDWWRDQSGVRNDATSPYTSDVVDNIPTGIDAIGLNKAGPQTLTFSEMIANPVFSFISLNGNGYAFLNHDFEILSVGDGSPTDKCGHWGCGTVAKNIVPVLGGTEYQLIGTGEPHGTIQFLGTFDTLTWRSLSAEHWNGMTVGVAGTALEVSQRSTAMPEPATLLLLGSGLVGIVSRARRKAFIPSR